MDSSRYQISVMVTNDCNFRCSYCPLSKHPGQIDSRHIEKLVRLIADAAPAAVDLNFHGGEPLLAWDQLVELTERATCAMVGRRLTTNICTNGTLFTPAKVEYLAGKGFNVRISLDGRRETHILNRHPAGAQNSAVASQHFNNTINGLELLVAAGVKTAVNMVVTPDTVNALLRNVHYLMRQGICSLSISPVIGQSWSGEQLLSLDTQLRALAALWQHWLAKRPTEEREDFRRSILAEINRAAYCLGKQANLPDARVLVIGAAGEIYGDEPEEQTKQPLRIGHLDEIESFAELPEVNQTSFELLFAQQIYPPDILQSLRRSHQILFNRMTEISQYLFVNTEP